MQGAVVALVAEPFDSDDKLHERPFRSLATRNLVR